MRKLFSVVAFLIISINTFSQDEIEKAATMIDNGQYESAVLLMNEYIPKHPLDELGYINRGIAYIYLAELAKGLDDLSTYISINSKNADAYNKRGFCYMNLGKEQEAKADFEKAISLNEKYIDAYENMGWMATKREDYTTAVEWYSKAIKINPASYNAYLQRGAAYRLMGEEAKSLEDLKLAIEIQPKNYEGYQYLAQLYQQQGLVDKTLEAIEKCIELDPKNSVNYVNASSIYLDAGNYDKARKFAEKAKEVNPKNYEAEEFLIMIDYAQEKYEVALANAKKLRAISKAGAKTYNVLGLYYWHIAMNADSAAYYFKEAIDMDKLYVYPYKNISDIFAYYKMSDDAIEGYSMAINLAPKDAFIYNKRGLVYLEQKQNILLAEEDFKTAMKLAPENTEFKNNYGRMFIGSNPEKANGVFDEILKTNPKYIYAYYNKAVIQINKENYKEAIALLDKAIKIEPKFSDANFIKGYCNIMLKDYKSGKAEFEKYIAMDDKNSTAYNNLGLCCSELKDNKNATIYFNKSIELDPKNSMPYYNRGKMKIKAGQAADGCADLKTASDLGNKDAEEMMKENCK